VPWPSPQRVPDRSNTRNRVLTRSHPNGPNDKVLSCSIGSPAEKILAFHHALSPSRRVLIEVRIRLYMDNVLANHSLSARNSCSCASSRRARRCCPGSPVPCGSASCGTGEKTRANCAQSRGARELLSPYARGPAPRWKTASAPALRWWPPAGCRAQPDQHGDCCGPLTTPQTRRAPRRAPYLGETNYREL
jgi:hypothetical protein